VTQGILSLPPDRLDAYLCNDLYKPRMHALYAELAPGVQLDFALNVRRTPAALAAIRAEDPELWAAFLAACTRRLSAPPYPAPILDALRCHPGGFVPPPPALARAERDGVAPLRWQEAGGQLAAFASGHSEAASHVETTLTQVVQELVVAAQVRRVRRARGAAPAAEALLGGALAALARGVERLNAEAHPEDEEEEEGAENGREGATQVVLFAGRRSSSRRYLLLQVRKLQRTCCAALRSIPHALETALGHTMASPARTVPRSPRRTGTAACACAASRAPRPCWRRRCWTRSRRRAGRPRRM
jgi:hypothetical protein